MESVAPTRFPSPLRNGLLRISPDEVLFERRGFHRGDPGDVARLESAGAEFVRGYGIALDAPEEAGARIAAREGTGSGFVYEGAAMALALLDALSPRRRDRLRAFHTGPAAHSVYTAHVGSGWALARLPKILWPRILRQLDSLLGWLAWDGYGFHQLFFAPDRPVRAPLPGYAAHAAAQGVGRALWFSCCADPDLIAVEVARYRPSYHGDLWSGVALAAVFAGGRRPPDRLLDLAPAHRGDLAQGAAFAAKALTLLGPVPDHAETAVEVLAGVSAAQAAQVTDIELAGLPPAGGSGPPSYEIWRRRVARRLSGRQERVH